MKALYTTSATATGKGRNGHVETEDGTVSLDLKVPKSLGGPGGGPNPEMLFAAGYAACFLSALKYAATIGLHKTDDASVTVAISLGPALKGGFALAASIDILLPSLTIDQATKLVKRAHKYCPYSNATRNNIDTKLTVNGVVLEIARG